MVYSQHREWWLWFERLQAHVAAGNSLTDQPKTSEERALMEWALENVEARSAGRLSPKQQLLLESVPGWEWALEEPSAQPTIDEWTQKAAEIGAFLRRTGRMPTRSRRNEASLHAWVLKQQAAYPDALEPAKVTALERIPGWRWESSSHLVTAARYARFQATRGRRPRGYAGTFEGDLALWAKRVRRKHAAGQLPAEAVSVVERIPQWQWSVDEER